MTRRLLSLLAAETARAARRLAREPRLVAIGVATIAAAAAPSLIFRLVDRAVLPALPFERSQDLVRIWQRIPWRMATSYPKLRYLVDHSRTMDVAATTGGELFLERSGASVRMAVESVTPSYFDVLQVRPLLGRTFHADENLRPFAHPVVILGEEAWRRHFDARPDVIGQTVRLSGATFTVVGVMPGGLRESFSGWSRATDAWIPAMMAPVAMGSKAWRETPAAIESPHATIWVGTGRLRPGHDLAEARTEAAVLGGQVKDLWPPPGELDAGSVEPFQLVRMSEDSLDPKILRAVSLLRVAGAFVLVLGGLNFGSVMLARGLGRERNLAIHSVLGAPRLALVWGAAAESLMLGLAGAPAALLLAAGLLRLLAFAEPAVLTSPFGVTFQAEGLRLDGGLAPLALGLSVLMAVVFALVPALRATRSGSAPLWRSGAGVRGGGLRRLRLTRAGGLLVAAEVTIAVAVTVPALLLVRSLETLVTADLGFRPEGVATAELRLPARAYPDDALLAFVSEATRRLGKSPGIESASWTSCLPIECLFFTTSVTRAGSRESGFSASVHVVAPDAFRTLGIPLRAGRDFNAGDLPSGPAVAIVSEDAARALGLGEPGARITAEGRTLEVIGIAGNVPYGDLAREPLPAIYLPLAQRPLPNGVLIVRSTRPLSETSERARQTVAALDTSLPRLEVTSLGDRVARNVARFRGASWLLGAAAVLAVFLCAVGIYGLFSSFVLQALPEIAVRMALGADRVRIGLVVARTALVLSGVGFLGGALLGSWGGSYLRGYLFGVQPRDTRALLLSMGVAAALALATALRPAQRASRADPMTVLRRE
jgi:predicted permease